MNIKNNKKLSNVFTLLLKNFIILTLLLIVAVFLLLALFLVRCVLDLTSASSSRLTEYTGLLETEAYDRFPADKVLGPQGFLAVLDEEGNTVYNQSQLDVSMTKEELSLLPLYGGETTITPLSVNDTEDTVHYQVQIRTVDTEGEESVRLYILDQDYHLLYTSGKDCPDTLSRKEFQILTQSYFDGYTVKKYPFSTESGQQRILLLFEPTDRAAAIIAFVGRAFLESIWLFLAAYCIFVFVFIWRMRRTILKPLQLLYERMESYTVGTDINEDYKGPWEFRNILDSFSSLAKRLNESEADRQRLAEAKQRMITDIAHDLKTPTTVVQGYAQALNDGIIPPEEQRNYFRIIAQKTNYLNELINTFYEYSKMEHPDYSLVLEKTDICEYFRNYAAEKYSELDTEGFLVNAEIPEKRIFCNIDRVQLKRAFNNIINNAIKHNRSGVTMFFHLYEREEQVEILLADSGAGIPPELAMDIFEPFIVGEQSRSKQGSGLGLSITKKIIEAHGGRILLLADPPAPMATAFSILLTKLPPA